MVLVTVIFLSSNSLLSLCSYLYLVAVEVIWSKRIYHEVEPLLPRDFVRLGFVPGGGVKWH